MKYGLTQQDIDQLQAAFQQFEEIEQVLVFGSRAKGNSKAASDVDLALKGRTISSETVRGLRAVLDDLPLPYFFDVVDYKAIGNKELVAHIDRVGKVIYAAGGA
jgi:predicted nucleotidyltransferase